MKRFFTKNMYFVFAFILILAGDAFGQAQPPLVIRGKVIDAKDKQGIIGASVVEVDKDNRTVGGVSTDIEGNFALKINNSANKMMVSFIGYETQKGIVIAGRTVINIALKSSSNSLDEIVIGGKKNTDNGTGMKIDKRNLTTAVATIDAKVLEEMQSASIDQALQGRLPGVDIAATSGDPGAGMQIRIRGTSSINGATNPLIVVDGMPYETEIPEDFNFASSDENNYAQLLNIAPSDIKDISVLKDAAATAVWGSRASNGVLIITTKRGSIGKPNITYTFKGSYSKQPSAIPLLNGNQYSTLISEEYYNAGKIFSTTEFAKEFQYDKNDAYNYYNFSNNTDWVKAITRIGYLQDHNVSISGGGERARYYGSLGYFNQQGTTKGTDLGRITTRINLDYTVSERIRFRTDVSYTHIANNQLYTGSKDLGVRQAAYIKMPNQSIYEYDEYGNLTSNYFTPAVTAQGYAYYYLRSNNYVLGGTYNPVSMALQASNYQLGDRVTPHFNVQYNVVPNVLTATSDVQFDINNSKITTFLPQIVTGRPITETISNRASDVDGDQFTVTTKTNLLYTPTLGEKHTFQGLLSLQSNDSRYVSQQEMSANSASSELPDVSSGGRTANSDLKLVSTLSQTRSVGALISAQYGFLDRYLINVGLRGDGNSRFGPNNRYGLFPSVSARYRLSGEPFMKRFNFIDDLSFRASYGQAGNAPKKDYRFYNTYNTYDFTYLGETGVSSSNLELTNLRWETVTGKNLGMNLNMFNNRVNMDVEVYRNRTTDLFYENLALSTYTGFGSVDMNVGTMDNQGWEFSINSILVRNKKWRVDFAFNIAQNQNMLREISPLYPAENNGKITSNGTYKEYLQVGNPFGSFYGFKFKGVYPTTESTVAKDADGNDITGLNGQKKYMKFYANNASINYQFQAGDAIYEDINHDGSIDYKDIVYLGNSNPKYTGGFGPSITFNGNLKLSAFFSFRTGYDLINGTKMATTNMSSYDNQSTAVLRRWKAEGDITDIPRAVYGSANNYNWLGSSRYVEDASFLRWRTVTVRYDLGKNLLKRINLKGLSVYMTAENILTLTKYTGQDPEVTTKISGPFSVAVDNSMTPPIKTVTMGISARF
ncbi:SusC/RagA family TonB-linked outer membrane protein [Pedobacter sp. MC2016-24]|uniref:SusC/RagA family TonB-linked outer membrane protein n=1 Tax=Pedobacter sp. MC2016-24 TaxID=2780090 RepID=UPI00187EC924|nr:SusC/RagA family TonB-linked outer membrane protein [Pedobacter sp. MC2016-24]MBE9599756.1 SusC/RagA family TonB-linked outer membrane protein [Pedobacter sp. MC2016-24]